MDIGEIGEVLLGASRLNLHIARKFGKCCSRVKEVALLLLEMEIEMKIFQIIFVVFSISAIAGEEDKRCHDYASEELKCILQHYPESYNQFPAQFWKVINKSYERAMNCTSIEEVEDFLRIVNLANSAVELEEFVQEGIEKLCMKKLSCFKEAVSKLDSNTRLIIRKKLENPLFADESDLATCY